MESSALREIGQVSDIEETITGSIRLRARKLLERISDTSNAESGSEVDDLRSPVAPEDVEYHSLAPVHEEVLHATVIKQMQMAETLEAVEESDLRRRKLCT